MKIELLAFGRAKELMGFQKSEHEIPENLNVEEFKLLILDQYPTLGSLTNFSIAINESYALLSDQIQVNDTVALIPPVSGG